MKTYYMRFGSGDPRTYTGVAATFLLFKTSDGTNITPPGITEVPSGTGIYYFNWGTTTSISFLADAATTSPGAAGRYVFGAIDPADRSDEYGITLTAIGTTNTAIGTSITAVGVSLTASGVSQIALGNTILSYLSGLSSPILIGIGSTASSFGSTSSDPIDLFGYLKRIQENLEGNNTFIKSTGVLSILSRGSSTLLATKTIANSVSTVIKT